MSPQPCEPVVQLHTGRTCCKISVASAYLSDLCVESYAENIRDTRRAAEFCRLRGLSYNIRRFERAQDSPGLMRCHSPHAKESAAMRSAPNLARVEWVRFTSPTTRNSI